jgi:hypothetical protein
MPDYPKAADNDFPGRFREIISDPLNLLIRRHPLAGYVHDGLVYLHNGVRVPVAGKSAYYGNFSLILVVNRGVHEPLEEFVFQELLKRLPPAPVMLELGAYWGHYSMWLQLARPAASVYLVEPDPGNLVAGKSNFERNGFSGTFDCAFVGRGRLAVDPYLARHSLPRLDILHADIQGYELEMLEGCKSTLSRGAIDYLFISTHSQELHVRTQEILGSLNYRVEVSSDFDSGTTSYDGLVFASHKSLTPLFGKFEPLSRLSLIDAAPADLVDFLSRTTTLSQDGGGADLNRIPQHALSSCHGESQPDASHAGFES